MLPHAGDLMHVMMWDPAIGILHIPGSPSQYQQCFHQWEPITSYAHVALGTDIHLFEALCRLIR